jgi:hypothetical protein
MAKDGFTRHVGLLAFEWNTYIPNILNDFDLVCGLLKTK